MVVRKRKKSRKLRGRTRTMGWGRIGQHRKSGSRGGFGAVGYHKHKVTWVIKYAPNWYGKHGFTGPRAIREEVKSINVGDLNELAMKLLASGKAKRENELVVLNLVEMGYDKVLGKGRVSLPLKIFVRMITEEAKKKIEEARGQVVIIE